MHLKYSWAEATAAGFQLRLRQGRTDKGQIYTAKVGAILKLAAYAPLYIHTILIIIWIHNVLHSAILLQELNFTVWEELLQMTTLSLNNWRKRFGTLIKIQKHQ